METPIVNNPNVFYFVSGEQLHTFGRQCADAAVHDAQAIWETQRASEHEPMFDKEDVAGIFKTSVRNVENWIAKQQIIPTVINGIVRFEGAEIARFKAAHKMNRKQNNQQSF